MFIGPEISIFSNFGQIIDYKFFKIILYNSLIFRVRDHSIAFKKAQEKSKENYFSNRKLLSMEKALEEIGYEKPDEYLYRALQYVDGFEVIFLRNRKSLIVFRIKFSEFL